MASVSPWTPRLERKRGGPLSFHEAPRKLLSEGPREGAPKGSPSYVRHWFVFGMELFIIEMKGSYSCPLLSLVLILSLPFGLSVLDASSSVSLFSHLSLFGYARLSRLLPCLCIFLSLCLSLSISVSLCLSFCLSPVASLIPGSFSISLSLSLSPVPACLLGAPCCPIKGAPSISLLPLCLY